jgi:hypothetical protein
MHPSLRNKNKKPLWFIQHRRRVRAGLRHGAGRVIRNFFRNQQKILAVFGASTWGPLIL